MSSPRPVDCEPKSARCQCWKQGKSELSPGRGLYCNARTELTVKA